MSSGMARSSSATSDPPVDRRGSEPPTPRSRCTRESRVPGQRPGPRVFDFASPPGQHISSITLRADVQGIAEFGFSLPQTGGMAPAILLSKRFDHVKFTARGVHERTSSRPRHRVRIGGDKLGTGLYSNTPAEVARRLLTPVGWT